MTPARGFRCHCGGPCRVTSVRKPQRGLIVRYRRCLACGERIITEERLSKGRRPTSGTPSELGPYGEIA